jgi:ribonuclease J
LNIIIHRGANEIGGTCIQLSTENTTILLDLGLPLSKESNLLDVEVLKPDAVLISHPHQDHYGLIDKLGSEIPVFIGELGKHLIDATRILIGSELHSNNFHHFKSWKPFTIGDFEVTPYLVDHSAVDAYGFLIEAEGKKVFYSGDFRAHGRKSVLYDNMIKNPPKDIDVLFMEGTMMERSNDDFPSEKDVEQKIYEIIKNQENITYIISSSQNIDRIVSAFKACKRSGKTLVIDIYTAWVLEQLKQVSNHIPAMEWEQVKVYASFSHDKRLKEHPEFFGGFRNRIYKYRVQMEELHTNPENYLFFGKMSHFRYINWYKEVVPVNVIYSQWLGYLSSTSSDYFGAKEIAAYKHDPQVNFVYAHTSGHATVKDLQKFATALKPKTVVPIHTEHAGSYNTLFNNVVTLPNNCNFNIKGDIRMNNSGKTNNESKASDHVTLIRFISDNKIETHLTPLLFLAQKVRDSKGELDLQLRNDYLNVYYKGNSLAKVTIHSDHFQIEVHKEFELAEAVKKDIPKKRFSVGSIIQGKKYSLMNITDPILFQKFFQDRIIKALATKIKNKNNGEEITFEQSLITDNIDNEKLIIIDRQVGGGGIPGKLDLLGLKQVASGRYKFAVLEVKLGNNPELKSDVAGQLNRYVTAIEKNFKAFKECYEKNYAQKKLLGLFPASFPSTITIEDGVIGKILVGSYSRIAETQIDELLKNNPHFKYQKTVIKLFHYLSDKI